MTNDLIILNENQWQKQSIRDILSQQVIDDLIVSIASGRDKSEDGKTKKLSREEIEELIDILDEFMLKFLFLIRKAKSEWVDTTLAENILRTILIMSMDELDFGIIEERESINAWWRLSSRPPKMKLTQGKSWQNKRLIPIPDKKPLESKSTDTQLKVAEILDSREKQSKPVTDKKSSIQNISWVKTTVTTDKKEQKTEITDTIPKKNNSQKKPKAVDTNEWDTIKLVWLNIIWWKDSKEKIAVLDFDKPIKKIMEKYAEITKNWISKNGINCLSDIYCLYWSQLIIRFKLPSADTVVIIIKVEDELWNISTIKTEPINIYN